MKAILVVFLAVCAYGQVTVREVSVTSAGQGVHRLGCLQANYQIAWEEAQQGCIDQGYKGLMSIKDAEAQAAAEYAMTFCGLSTTATPWIGLHRAQTSENWTWADGTVLEGYTNWWFDTPPNDAVRGGIKLWSDEQDWGKWYSNMVSKSAYCLCEG